MRLTRVYSEQPLPSQGDFFLGGEAAYHLLRVMRLRVGQQFVAFDGSGLEITAQIDSACRAESLQAHVIKATRPDCESPLNIWVYMALVKGERFDWAIEKLTELGAYAIVPVMSEFTQVRDPGEEKVKRWQRLAESAACQCGRVQVPHISEPLSFSLAAQQSIQHSAQLIFLPGNTLLTLDSLPNNCQSLALFIGPEGGFSSAELELANSLHFKPAGLGRHILRVETAALTAMARLLS